jgi:O-antigen ligase
VAEHRAWVAAAATALFLAQLLSQSRSGLLGCAVGLLVLAIALRRDLLRRELVIPVLVLGLAACVVVVAKRDQLQQVLDSRFQTGDRSSRIHTDLYDLIPPVLESHPALGLGLNNFAVYYEFETGKTDFGPHSFYIAVLTETGLVGAALYLAFLAWTVSRLLVLLRAGRARAALPDDDGTTAAIAWGFAAGLAAILAGNLFYLTMIFNVHYCFLLLLLTAPVVLAPEQVRQLVRQRLPFRPDPAATPVPVAGD